MLAPALADHLKKVESKPTPVEIPTQRLNLPTEPIPRASGRSKVFDEDPTEAVGTGLIPWLVLVAAIAALVLWFLL